MNLTLNSRDKFWIVVWNAEVSAKAQPLFTMHIASKPIEFFEGPSMTHPSCVDFMISAKKEGIRSLRNLLYFELFSTPLSSVVYGATVDLKGLQFQSIHRVQSFAAY